jgi:hypothetical protein
MNISLNFEFEKLYYTFKSLLLYKKLTIKLIHLILPRTNTHNMSTTPNPMNFLPQEMINKIIYQHEGLETPSAKAMKTLITQVQESMDNFSEYGKDINYYMAMLGYMKESTPESMWGHYLLAHCADYGDMPDCWIHRNGQRLAYDMSLMDIFPREWEDAAEYEDEDGEPTLPDDPKDLTYDYEGDMDDN